jgi:ATP-binding cassette subfamily B protein
VSATRDEPTEHRPSRLSVTAAHVTTDSAPLAMTTRKRLRLLLGDRLSSVVILGLASVVSALAEAGILATSAQAAAALVNARRSIRVGLGPVHLTPSVKDLLLVGLGLAILRLLLQGVTSYYPGAITADVQAMMRSSLLASYSTADWELQSRDREGHFQELMTNQVQLASQGANQATQLVVYGFTFLILALSAFALNVTAALGVFAAALVLLAAMRPITRVGRNLAKRLSAAQLEYAGAIGETNRMTEEVSVFGVAIIQRQRVGRFIAKSRDLVFKTNLIQRAVPNLYQSLIYLTLVVGLLAVDLAHVKGFSSLGAVVLILVRAGSYGQSAQGSWVSMQQALPYVERVQNVSDIYEHSERPKGTMRMRRTEAIAFDDVSYGYYEDRPVLKRLSFKVRGGETIGIVGPSGAGKSTMVQILLRLRVPSDGRYLVNGDDASDYRSEDWHRRVAYVPQQPRLLHATVAENVRFFRDIDDETVEHACRLARIHDDILSWSDGYNTIVGPRADAVSGGQQQRLCLARALAARPDILILDEPTSALDPRSEALIQDSLMALQSELTMFIVAHRMSTLTICNRVMVVLDGSVDGFGTVEELKRSNAYYRSASATARPGTIVLGDG